MINGFKADYKKEIKYIINQRENIQEYSINDLEMNYDIELNIFVKYCKSFSDFFEAGNYKFCSAILIKLSDFFQYIFEEIDNDHGIDCAYFINAFENYEFIRIFNTILNNEIDRELKSRVIEFICCLSVFQNSFNEWCINITYFQHIPEVILQNQNDIHDTENLVILFINIYGYLSSYNFRSFDIFKDFLMFVKENNLYFINVIIILCKYYNLSIKFYQYLLFQMSNLLNDDNFIFIIISLHYLIQKNNQQLFIFIYDIIPQISLYSILDRPPEQVSIYYSFLSHILEKCASEEKHNILLLINYSIYFTQLQSNQTYLKYIYLFTKKAIPEIFYLINDEESFLNIFIEKFEESNHEEKEIIFLIIIKIINEFPNLIIIYFQQLISVFSHIAISETKDGM